MHKQIILAALLLIGLSTSAIAGPFSVRINVGAYIPAPVIITSQPAGRYVDVVERTWVPGYNQTVWVPTQYTTAYDANGVAYTVAAVPGHYETQTVPGYYREQTVRQWVAYDATSTNGYLPVDRYYDRGHGSGWDRNGRNDRHDDRRDDYRR